MKFKLIMHHHSESAEFSGFEEDKRYVDVAVPDENRTSKVTDLIRDTAHFLWHQQILLGKEPLFQDYQVMQYFIGLIDPSYVPKEFFKLISEDFIEDSTTSSELLSHVRECENHTCFLGKEHSKFSFPIMQQFNKDIVRYVQENFPDKDETIFFGEFASGSLLRTLQTVKALKDIGYKKFEFLFLDIIYDDLLQLASDVSVASKLSATRIALVNMQYKSLMEFGHWIIANLGSGDTEIGMHCFSRIEDAELFFKTSKKRLTLLVGRDYDIFTKDVNAHRDFMRLAQMSLDRRGQYFELGTDSTQLAVHYNRGGFVDGVSTTAATKIVYMNTNAAGLARNGVLRVRSTDSVVAEEKSDVMEMQRKSLG